MAPAINNVTLHASLFVPADLLEGAFEHRTEIPGIELSRRLISDEASHVERHLLRGNEVASPHIRRIDAKISGRDIDQAFAEEIRFDSSGAAVGAGRRLVGDVCVDLAGEVWKPVWPRQELGSARRGGAAGAACIGADVDGDFASQSNNGAVTLAGDFELAGRFARMVGREEMLAPILDPLHRAIKLAGQRRDKQVLRIELAANAKAAARVRHLHDDGAFR